MQAMPENNGPSWPKTPAGTTGWETVFEDPQTGLIALIHQAHTETALCDCTALIIEQLHSHKDDPAVVKQFTDQLHQLIPDDTKGEDLAPTMEAVIAVLRQIKQERIAKAEQFLAEIEDQERKVQSKARKERRKTSLAAEAVRKEEARRSPLLWGGLGLAAVGLIAVVVVSFLSPEKRALSGSH